MNGDGAVLLGDTVPTRFGAKGTRISPPDNLPLPVVDYTVSVSLADLTPGSQFPPERCLPRARQFEDLFDAAHNQIAKWVDVPNPVNRFWPVVELTQALGTDIPPESADRDSRELIPIAARGFLFLYIYGRTVVIAPQGQPMILPDMRRIWPLAEDPDGWVMVLPAAEGAGSTADILVVSGGQIGGWRAEWSGTGGLGTIGVPVPGGEIEPVACRVAYADRGSSWSGWGNSLIEHLVPVLVGLARREAGVEHVLDLHEHPMFVVESSAVDSVDVARALGNIVPDGGDVPDAATLQKVTASLSFVDVLILTTGLKNPHYVQWDSDMAASFQHLNRLDQQFTMLTGMAPVEVADEADRASAAALARRQAALVVRIREMHTALSAMLEAVTDSLVWPWVDTLGETAVPPSGPDPAIDAPTDLPGAM